MKFKLTILGGEGSSTRTADDAQTQVLAGTNDRPALSFGVEIRGRVDYAPHSSRRAKVSFFAGCLQPVANRGGLFSTEGLWVVINPKRPFPGGSFKTI